MFETKEYLLLILIMCMAGFNTRFHNVGFDVPKYLLPWEGSVILDGILSNLGASENFSRVILLPNQRDSYFKSQLLQVADLHGIANENVIYIPDTLGQAYTAAIGAKIAGETKIGDEPIAFHNADTILLTRDWHSVEQSLQHRDIFIDVFPGSNPAYSYVAIQDGKVSRIKEKTVISPFATSGFYAFKDPDYYLRGFDACSPHETTTEREQIYISSVIQTLIDSGADVFVNELNDDSNTLVLGTPEEYGLEMAKKELGESNI